MFAEHHPTFRQGDEIKKRLSLDWLSLRVFSWNGWGHPFIPDQDAASVQEWLGISCLTSHQWRCLTPLSSLAPPMAPLMPVLSKVWESSLSWKLANAFDIQISESIAEYRTLPVPLATISIFTLSPAPSHQLQPRLERSSHNSFFYKNHLKR